MALLPRQSRQAVRTPSYTRTGLITSAPSKKASHVSVQLVQSQTCTTLRPNLAVGAEPSGLLNADATVPLAPGRPGQPLLQPVPPEHAANRKNERMERRELLYTVVRDAMVRAGVFVGQL